MVTIMESATLLTLRIPGFEAAIRKAVDSHLASRPVVAVTSFKPLGRVISVCPDARNAGLSEEMHYTAARELCPDAAFFVPDRQLAEKAMRAVLRMSLTYSPQVESAGGGCIMLDTRGTEKLWGESLHVAEKAQRDIREKLRLPLAAGLAARRPWSLLASRAAGDRDIIRVLPGDEYDFLDSVPATWIDGITAKTRTRLMEMNIRTAGQLRQFGREHIIRQFGPACGDVLWNVLHPQIWQIGVLGQSAVQNTQEMIRVEAYLPEASVEEDKTQVAAKTLAGQVAAQLRKRDQGAGRLQLTLMHADGVLKSAFAATGGFIQAEDVLTDITLRLLKRTFQRRVRITRLWITAEKLASPERQGSLFSVAADDTEMKTPHQPDDRKTGELLHTLDQIRAKYGDVVMKPAALLRQGHTVTLPQRLRVS